MAADDGPAACTMTAQLVALVLDAPEGRQNRIHLDLTTTSLDDQGDTVAELLAIGATHTDVGQGPDETHVVLADPEGNEFCIIEPSNRFLASCVPPDVETAPPAPSPGHETR